MEKKLEQIEWEAPEYVVPEKGGLWFLILGLVAAGGLAVSIWFQQWVWVVLIIVIVIALITRSVVKPRVVKYKLDEKGLREGEKLYEIEDYKTFGVIREGSDFYVSLRPKTRFGLRLNVVIPGNKGEKIVDFLGARMPMEDVKEDFFDKLVRWLKI